MNTLSPAKSDFLNFLRWTAALFVVLGHVDMYLSLFAGNSLTKLTSFGYLGVHAHASVIIFFVLSGYVVAYSADIKSSLGKYKFRDYFLDRFSRIYSVLLTAIIFTLALDFMGDLFSEAYKDPEMIPQDNFFIRLLANLLGIQGVWGYRIQLGSNPTLWSVGHEFLYYILFGILKFRQQLFSRAYIGIWIAILILCLAGTSMAVYFFVWLTGVAAYYASRSKIVKCFRVTPWVTIVGIIIVNHLIMYSMSWVVWFVRDSLFALMVAILLSLNFHQRTSQSLLVKKINTYMSSFSYSIYAFHTPIIFFALSLLFDSWIKNSNPLFFGIVLVAFSVILARGFFYIAESRRVVFRQIFDKLMRRIGV